jgi:hypothetical protein
VEPLESERGQGLIVIALALAIAAAAVVGLRSAQDRIVAEARVQRAGEAAVEAAAHAVAKAYVAQPSLVNDLVTDPRVVEAARSAAEELARENGAAGVESVAVSCSGQQVEVRLFLAGHSHHAGFEAPECSRR